MHEEKERASGTRARIAATFLAAALFAFAAAAAAPADAHAAVPAKGTVYSAKAKSTTSVSVTAKKVAGASGYQVKCSASSSFANPKTVTSSARTKTVKGLKAGKKYYVKVRAYRLKSGRKVYGAWSKAKTVRTKYSIAYKLNGGRQAAGQKRSYTGTTPTFALKSPSRTGYAFKGWYTTSTFKAGTKVAKVRKGSSGNKVYHAKWAPKVYAIAYDLAGGTASGLKAAYTVETATFPLASPVRGGYVFLGWIDPSGAKASKIAKGSIGDRSYTATWGRAYSISYDAQGGGFGGAVRDAYAVEEGAVALPVPERAGYEFLGWDDGSGEPFSSIPEGTSGDISLAAVWKVAEYKVSYHLDGGRNADSNPASYTMFDGDISLADPERPCRGFEGWFSDASCQTPASGIPSGSTGEVSFWAKWSEPHHTPAWVVDDDGMTEVAAWDEPVRRWFYVCGNPQCEFYKQEVAREHQKKYLCNLSDGYENTTIHHDAYSIAGTPEGHCECAVCHEALTGHVHTISSDGYAQRNAWTETSVHSGYWCLRCRCEVDRYHPSTAPANEMGHCSIATSCIVETVEHPAGLYEHFSCSGCGYGYWGEQHQ